MRTDCEMSLQKLKCIPVLVKMSLPCLLIPALLACGNKDQGTPNPDDSLTASGGEQFEYDVLHRVTRFENANGQIVHIGYDAMGRIRQLKTPDQTGCGPAADDCLAYYEYDAVGNRTLMKDPSGSTTYLYDDLNRLESLQMPQGYTIGYNYDASNRLTKIAYPSGRILEYQYDQSGNLYQVVDNGVNETSTLFYQRSTGLLERVVHPNLETQYTYDNQGRLTGILHRSLAQNTVAQYTYQLDAIGRAISMNSVTPDGATSEAYAYDLSGNLTTVEYGDGRVLTFGYDVAGNRTSLTDSASHIENRRYIYGQDNRLTAVTDENDQQLASYRYDYAGNLTERVLRVESTETNSTEELAGDHRTLFEYDHRNLATSIYHETSGQQVRFMYNGDGQRVSKTVRNESGTETSTFFVVDPNAPQDRVLEERDHDGALVSSFGYLGSRVFSMMHAGRLSYLLSDRLGSIRALSDRDGAVKERYEYDPFFRNPSGPLNAPNPYRFAGERFDAETGLVFMRARYYDPAIGRFISKDPSGIKGGSNMYRYVRNDPINLKDPSGRVEVRGDDLQNVLGTAQDWLNTTIDFVQANGWVPSEQFTNTVGVINLIDSAIKEPANVETILTNNPLSLSSEAWRTGDYSAVSSYAGSVTGHVGFATGVTWAVDSLGLLGAGGMGSIPVIPLAMGTGVGGFKLGNFFAKASERFAEDLPGLIGDLAAVQDRQESYLGTSILKDGKNPFARPSLSQSIQSALVSPQIDFGFEPFDPLSGLDFFDFDGGLKLDLGSFDYFSSQWASGPLSTFSFGGFTLDLTTDPFAGGLDFGFGFSGAGLNLSNSLGTPGGVLIDQAATLIGHNVSDVEGAFFDPESGELTFLGKRSDDRVPGLDPDYIKGALSSVYRSVSPAFLSLESPVSLKDIRPPLTSEIDNIIKEGEVFHATVEYKPVWDTLQTKITINMLLQAAFRHRKLVFEQDLVPELVRASGPSAKCNVLVTLEDSHYAPNCPDSVNASSCLVADLDDLPLLSITLNKDCVPGRIYAQNCRGESMLIDRLEPLQRVKRGGLWWERDEDDVYRIDGRAATIWTAGEGRTLTDGEDARIEVVDARVARHFASQRHPSRIDVTFRNMHPEYFYFRSQFTVYSPEHHRVFRGEVEDTRIGWVMYEADRILKCLAIGRCYEAGDRNRVIKDYNSGTIPVPGFQSLAERVELSEDKGPSAENQIKGVSTRLWFAVDDMVMRRFVDDDGTTSVTWDEASFKLYSAGQVFGVVRPPGPASTDFINHFNANIDRFSALSFVVSDPDRPGQTKSVRIFDELRKVVQAVAVARFLRDNAIPIDMSWSQQAGPKRVHIPRSVPTVVNTFEDRRSVIGGVEGRLKTDYNPREAGDQGPSNYEPSQTAKTTHERTLGARPDTAGSDVDPSVWETEEGRAVSARTDGAQRAGKRRLSEVDLSFRRPGGLLKLTRSYDGARLASNEGLGGGWTLAPLKLEFEQPSLRDPRRSMRVWRDRNMDTHLRVGRARVVNHMTGAVLDFHSTLEWDDYGIKAGLNNEGRPDFLAAQQQNGATLSQLPEDQGYTLRMPSGTVHQFDTRGLLMVSEDARSRSLRYQYTSGRLESMVDEASGRQIQVFYDEVGVAIACEGPYRAGDDRNTRIEYDYTDGRLSKVTNVRSGVSVLYRYDARGRLIGRVGADGQETVRDNTICEGVNPPPCCDDGLGRTCSIERNTKAWQFTFDRDVSTDIQSVTTVMNAGELGSVEWRSEFNGFGRLNKYVDNNGQAHQILWDTPSSSLPSGYQSPFPGTGALRSERSLDGVVKVINPNNLAAAGAPDLEVEWLQKNESGEFVTQSYIGKPYALVNAAGHRVEFAYQAQTGEIQTITRYHRGNPHVTLVKRTPNPAGDRIVLTDPSGAEATIELNSLDLVTKVASASGVEWSYEYDGHDRIWRVHVPTFTGSVDYIEYGYDRHDRVTTMRYPDGSQIEYTYDPRTLRLASVKDRLGRVTTYEYDDIARPQRTTVLNAGPLGEDLVRTVSYNEFGSVQTMTFPGQTALTYEPDDLGRLGRIRVGSLRSKVVYPGRVSSRTVYEDAEDMTTSDWIRKTSGTVENIEGGTEPGVRAIRVVGNAANDVFELRAVDGQPLHNTDQPVFEFSMRLEAPGQGNVLVEVETTKGNKFLVYHDGDELPDSGNALHIGLGDIADGRWYAFLRDLPLDLSRKAPGAELLSVKGIFVRGTVEIDNIALLSVERTTCTGETAGGSSGWINYGDSGIYVEVDTSKCGFLSTPVYLTSLNGQDLDVENKGVSSIYQQSATGFTIYLKTPVRAKEAETRKWKVQWQALKKGQNGRGLCSGHTPIGATAWRQFGAHGLVVDVDTSECGFDAPPQFLTSLGGRTKHWVTKGGSSIYSPKANGFTTYIKNTGPITPAEANSRGWFIQWRASDHGAEASGECAGKTPPGQGWEDHAPGVISINVESPECASENSLFLTSLQGHALHWIVEGVTSVEPTATGFRVLIRGVGVSAQRAQERQWSINWVALD